MIKLLIAGYESQTVNYRSAFSRLGAGTLSLGKAPWETADPPSGGQLSGGLSSSSVKFRPDADSLACLCDGLVLPGGGDIAPSLFHCQPKGSRNIDEALDRFQLALLHSFLRAGKPVLGICKGLQIINVAFGGTIIQDLNPSSLAVHAWDGHDRIHATRAPRDSFPFRLYGPHPMVNSAHHQAAGSIGSGLRVAQYAEDFVVEALYHEKLPVLAVQWHPERMCFSHARNDTGDGSLLLKYFLSLF